MECKRRGCHDDAVFTNDPEDRMDGYCANCRWEVEARQALNAHAYAFESIGSSYILANYNLDGVCRVRISNESETRIHEFECASDDAAVNEVYRIAGNLRTGMALHEAIGIDFAELSPSMQEYEQMAR